jgi:hypothetical protein
MSKQHIDIQNVIEFMFTESYNSDTIEAIPAMPPFDEVHLYYKNTIGTIEQVIKTSRIDDLTPVEAVRVFLSDTNTTKLDNFIIDYDDNKEQSFYISNMTAGFKGEYAALFVKWMTGEDGYIVRDIDGNYLLAVDIHENMKGAFEDKNDLESFCLSQFSITWVTFALMHVKNIELIDQPISRQVRRRKERKGEPFYKVLSLEPFKKQVRNEARETGQTEMQRALHLCRGHFVTYSEERPLFGKYSGTYWKPAHMRGSANNGEVVKDYKIDV